MMPFEYNSLKWSFILWGIHHYCCLTISQCLSLMPGLQMVLRMGRCCLNLSTLFLTVSATRRGPAWSLNCLVSLYMVLHMSPTSFSISSEFRFWNGPINKQILHMQIFFHVTKLNKLEVQKGFHISLNAEKKFAQNFFL